MKTNKPIQLSDHFGYRKLLRFTLPTIATMIFTSIYSVWMAFSSPISWTRRLLRPST